MNIQDLALSFFELPSMEGYSADVQMIPGDVDVIQIILADYEEVPVYISVTDSQILCITYLWTEDEIDPARRMELFETLLEMNIPMPLSSFAKVDNRYAVFGALAMTSSINEIAHEVVTLMENAVEALTALEDYFV